MKGGGRKEEGRVEGKEKKRGKEEREGGKKERRGRKRVGKDVEKQSLIHY